MTSYERAYVNEVGQVGCPQCMEARFVVLNKVNKEEGEVLCYCCCSGCGRNFVFRKNAEGKVLRD